MGNFQQFCSTTKINIMLLSLHTQMNLPLLRCVSTSVLSSSICNCLGEDIIQLLVTPWGRLLSSSIWNWLSGGRHYPVPSWIDSLKEDIILLLVTPWGKLLSSSIYNWLSWRKHYSVSSDSLGKNIIQLHLQLTLLEKTLFSSFWRSWGRHDPAPSGIDSLKEDIIQFLVTP